MKSHKGSPTKRTLACLTSCHRHFRQKRLWRLPVGCSSKRPFTTYISTIGSGAVRSDPGGMQVRATLHLSSAQDPSTPTTRVVVEVQQASQTSTRYPTRTQRSLQPQEDGKCGIGLTTGGETVCHLVEAPHSPHSRTLPGGSNFFVCAGESPPPVEGFPFTPSITQPHSRTHTHVRCRAWSSPASAGGALQLCGRDRSRSHRVHLGGDVARFSCLRPEASDMYLTCI